MVRKALIWLLGGEREILDLRSRLVRGELLGIAPLVAAGIMAGAGLLGGKGSRKAANAANQPRTTTTNQTTTSAPPGFVNPLIDQLVSGSLDRFNNAPRLPSFRGGGSTPQLDEIMSQLQGFQGSASPDILSFMNTALNDPTGGNALSASTFNRAMGPGRFEGAFNSFLGNNPFAGLVPQAGNSGGTGGGGGGGSFSFFGGGGGGGPVNGQAFLGDVLAGNTVFADELRKFLDPSRLDPLNDPTMQPFLDALNAQAARGFKDILTPLESRASAAGAIGSAQAGNLVARSAADQSQRLAEVQSGTLMDARQAALEQMMQALGLAGTRDIATGQIRQADAASQRSAQAAHAATAASAASAANRIALERELGLGNLALGSRGQDLSALLGLLGEETSRLGIGADLSGNLNQLRLGSMGAGLDVNNQELQALLGAGNIGSGIADRNLGAAQMRFQSDLQRAMQGDTQLDNLLRRTLGLASLGGTSTLSGTNVQPGAGIDPKGAAISGGLGAALSAMGGMGSLGALGGAAGGANPAILAGGGGLGIGALPPNPGAGMFGGK